MHSSHKISKLIFEVSMDGDENHAKEMQSEVERMVLNHITEVLDKSLSKFDDGSVDFIIDKLEIDVGSFDLKNNKEKFFKEIAEKVEQEIQRIYKDSNSQYDTVSIKPKAKGVADLVFYILRNGHLPWWVDFAEKVNVNDFFKQYIKQPSSKLSTLLKKEVKNPVFRKRLIYYLTVEELVGCINVLMPLLITKNKLITEKCKASSLFKEQFFNLLLQLPIQTKDEQIVETIATTFRLLKESKVSPKTINLGGLTLPKEILSRLKLLQLSLMQLSDEEIKEFELINSKDKKTGKKAQQTTKKKQAEESGKDQDQTEIDDSTQIENYSDEETENSIEISNAGLVLIIPFLSRFFENIGIIKNKEFNSEAEQHYAVYLLHYIATDNQDLPQEHELFFEKLICGIDVNDVLKPCSSLEKEHQAEVEELLKAIVENWTALKSSSPQTLQTAFLQRPGYLIQRDDGAWSLHIERQTIDILLDRIPWTISIGRLPFSGMMIYTEW